MFRVDEATSGHDTVLDFTKFADSLRIVGSEPSEISFSDLTIEPNGSNTEVYLPDGQLLVVLANFNAVDLAATDFWFT